jgi:phage terminase large subunit
MAAESVRDYNEAMSLFDSSEEGPLKIWAAPHRDNKYIIGADVALGVRGDYSVATVLNNEREICAIYRSNRIDPVRFGKLCFYLGRWYNNALVCPESNSIGLATVQQLFGMNYPNIYQQKKTANTAGDNVNHLGFKTTMSTRPPIISNLRKMIEDEDIMIPCAELLDELRNFIITENGKAEASVGHHDDMVMSLAITCEAYRTHGHALTNKSFSWGETNTLYTQPDTKWL